MPEDDGCRASADGSLDRKEVMCVRTNATAARSVPDPSPAHR